MLAVEKQRIGSDIPPVHAAGLDPAYIPSLVPSGSEVADEANDTALKQGGEATPTDAVPSEEAAVPNAQEDPADEEDNGPVFEVSDRRGAIVADRAGITFRLDEEVAEFGWDEIGAVEIDTPRFGRRFGVTVYMSGRRWFQADVEAPSRGVLKEWAAELDTVLDARFEETEA
ncbi:hypothetical protein HRW23_11540 [Streptomyces lunaelactis]|nr:hypothetical protein [Streptomyces lunaelactis]NUK13015.1 hypothetical protein [Streptomyces lunaelactis]NUK13810.1 hypothetical protein [Streptomyces lunaelactis]NUK78023.1 hypothetical protein [Streptomyces lunaelactis]NUL08940.1 hypothetical protein [Streptomyces lunaelactis]